MAALPLGDDGARLAELFVCTKPIGPKAGSGAGTPGQELAVHETSCSHSSHELHTSVFLVTHFRVWGTKLLRDRDLAMAQQLAHRRGTEGLGG